LTEGPKLSNFKTVDQFRKMMKIGGPKLQLSLKYEIFKALYFKPKIISPINFILLIGLEHVGGDMFESVPSGDAILLKVGLHAK